MTMEQNSLAAWGQLIDDAPIEGLDRETLRRAMSLNPALKAQLGTTNKVLQQLKAASAASSEAKEQTARPTGRSFAEIIEQSKDRYQNEAVRLRSQLAKAQAELARLKPHTLDTLMGALLDLDPNMVSPLTMVSIKREQGFFDELGFSLEDVVTRQLKRR